MTALQVFSLVLLVFAFVLAIWRDINVGLVTLPAAFLLAEVAHLTPKELYAGFPTSLVILVLGVMYLFGHAEHSGALSRVVRGGERLVGTHVWLLPWIGFGLAAAISAMGALPGATVAIVMPITMEAARRRGINSMMMGLITIFGALAGGFSPISVFGLLIKNLAEKEHFAVPSGTLFITEFVMYVIVALASFFIYRGLTLVRGGAAKSLRFASSSRAQTKVDRAIVHPVSVTAPALSNGLRDVPSRDPDRGAASKGEERPAEPPAGPRAYEIGSLLAVGVFVAAVLGLGLDVGLTAFALGLLLHAAFKIDDKRIIAALPWGVALILGGLLTYIGVVLKLGTFTVIANGLQQFHNVAISALLLAVFAAFFSSFESSSVTVIAISIPIVLKVEAGVAHNIVFLILLVVAFCSAAISTSPYHVNGALLVTNGGIDSPEVEQILFRKLLLWTAVAAFVLPLITWTIPLVALMIS